MTNAAAASIEPSKLDALVGTMVNEMGAAGNSLLIGIGDTLGLFRSLAKEGPFTSAELAHATGTHERYIREWLAAQAASGWVNYDPKTTRFSMSAEQTAILADEDSPVFMGGGFHSLAAAFLSHAELTEAFKSGAGVGWGDHSNCLFCGVERFFRPGYKAHLVNEWLPAVGVVETLQRGARVADVGCGHGASTYLMADAFPNSEFVGIDFHEPSIVHASSHIGTRRNVRFEVAKAQDYAGQFDFVTLFDALHDMGDPVGAAEHICASLKPDGKLMIVEPMAGDRLEDNFNPVGRVFYAYSTSLCVAGALSQDKRNALGAQAGQRRLTEVLQEGGFKRIRRATQTPFNMVLEASV